MRIILIYLSPYNTVIVQPSIRDYQQSDLVG